MVFKLAHISDIHLGPLPKATLRELAGKRVTGYLNWKRNRAKDMGSETLQNIVQAVHAQEPDHIAITGDLINIGLDLEVEVAGQWLRANFDPASTSVVPGNHDAYIRGTLAKALSAWAPFMANSKGGQTLANAQFPYLRVQENVAVIGASSAIATPAFVAAGRFGRAQAKRLGDTLKTTGEDGQFRVVLIHHPPIRNATLPRKRLYGIGLFQKVIAEHGAELVLHGHTHLPQRHTIKGPSGRDAPVVGVSAAGQAHGGKKPAAAFNMFEISREDGMWQCQLKTFTSSATTLGAVELTEDRLLSAQSGVYAPAIRKR